MRRALGTVTHSQANSRRDSYEPRRVSKKLSRRSVVGSGRQSVGGGATSQYADSRPSMSGRQSLGPPAATGRKSMAGRQSTGTGRKSLGGRASIGSMSRRSSIHSAATAVSDTRPLNDASFRSEVTRRLIQFLTENGYNHPISPKLLTAPSDKDYYRIFQFLYHRIDPNFRFASASGGARDRKSMAGRRDAVKATETMVEQIPALLKELKYPVKINRSTVISCGSKSNWPKMLGVLHFLLDLVTLRDTVDIASQIFGPGPGAGAMGFAEDEAAGQHNQLMFQYNAEAYHAFLEGNDDLKAEYDEEMHASFQDEIDRITEQIEAYRTQTDGARRELAQLSAGESPLVSLNARKLAVSKDVEQFRALITKLTAHEGKQRVKLEEAHRELDRLSEEKEALDDEVLRLRDIHAKQELTPEDVVRMKTAESKLSDQIQQLSKQKEDMHQRAWKFEMQLSKAREETEKIVNDFNSAVQQIVPAQALQSTGSNLQIQINPAATEPGQPLFTTDPNNLLSCLRTLLDDVNTEVHKAEQKKLEHVESLAKLSEAIADRQTQNNEAELKIESLGAKYKQRKAEYDEAHRGKMSSIESMQEEVVQMHEHLSAQATELARQREAVELELEAVRDELQSERDSIAHIVTDMAETVVKHKQTMQECIAAYRTAVAEAQ